MEQEFQLNQVTDNIINSVCHVLEQATQTYCNICIQQGLLPKPTTQEEIQKLAMLCMRQLGLVAITKSTHDPVKMYPEEAYKFLNFVAANANDLLSAYMLSMENEVLVQRPEGVAPPQPEVEDDDPIVKAQQGKSSIIIPGIND